MRTRGSSLGEGKEGREGECKKGRPRAVKLVATRQGERMKRMREKEKREGAELLMPHKSA